MTQFGATVSTVTDESEMSIETFDMLRQVALKQILHECSSKAIADIEVLKGPSKPVCDDDGNVVPGKWVHQVGWIATEK